MNFLIKIEEAINGLILMLLGKLKALVPHFIFDFLSFLKHLPHFFKEKIQIYKPKLRIIGLKFVGYLQHYITGIRGYFMVVIMYLRSEEFKKANKKELFLKPFKFTKTNPVKSSAIILSMLAVFSVSSVIYKNMEKIVLGAKSLRGPASAEIAEEDVFLNFKNHKFEVKIAPAGGGGHGAAAAPEHHEFEIFLDLTFEAKNPADKEFLEHMEEMLDDNMEALELPVTQLPLTIENQKIIEDLMVKALNEDFLHMTGRLSPIKSVKLKQVLPSRPVYFRQEERMTTITDINLQIFLEDTHRNRQVWIDFSVLASNRNVILYLKDHDVEIKDHLTTNVEPVIPQLPVEEEGRLIIKEKMRSEINQYLEKHEIEGKILEVYIDYLMAS